MYVFSPGTQANLEKDKIINTTQGVGIKITTFTEGDARSVSGLNYSWESVEVVSQLGRLWRSLLLELWRSADTLSQLCSPAPSCPSPHLRPPSSWWMGRRSCDSLGRRLVKGLDDRKVRRGDGWRCRIVKIRIACVARKLMLSVVLVVLRGFSLPPGFPRTG